MTRSEILYRFFESDEAKQMIPVMTEKYTDKDIAAIIWHSDLDWKEKHTELDIFMHNTSDEDLRSQINDRLEYDAKCLDLFKEKSDGYIYVVDNREYGTESNILGYFGNAKIAIEAGIREGYEFNIYKHQIIYDEKYIPKCRAILSPHVNKNIEEQLEEYQSEDGYVSRFEYDKEGNILDYWSNEMQIDNLVRSVETLSNQRFENMYVEMPNPFEEGDNVRYIPDGREYTVQTSQEDWQKIVAEAKKEDSEYNWFSVMITVKSKDSNKKSYINPVCLTKI